MTLNDTAVLITQVKTKGPNGYPVVEEMATEALVDVKSVKRAEFYEARKAGMSLSISFEMWAADYAGQPYVDYGGKRYKVERTYSADGEILELNCSEVTR